MQAGQRIGPLSRGSWVQIPPGPHLVDRSPSRDIETETALKIIGRRILKGSTVYTGFFKAYLSLGEARCRHEVVNHLSGEWVGGECHINGCENRVSLLRPWLAVYRGICKDNLSLYLAAFKAYGRSRSMKPHRSHQGNPKERSYFHDSLAIMRDRPSLEATIQKPATPFLFMNDEKNGFGFLRLISRMLT